VNWEALIASLRHHQPIRSLPYLTLAPYIWSPHSVLY